jgi:hypothetical protein
MNNINVTSIYWIRYQNFINSRQNRVIPHGEITEMHHIIPKCAGGHDTPDNIVKLTYREHFIAHWLLSKVGIGTTEYKLKFAFGMMSVSSKSNDYRKHITSRQFEISKKVRGETLIKFNNINSPVKGKKWYADEDGTIYRCHPESPVIEELGLKFIGSILRGTKWYTDGENFFMLQPDNPLIETAKLWRGSPNSGVKKMYSRQTKDKLTKDRSGRYWYNDGTKSYKLKCNDSKITDLNLSKGRLLSEDSIDRIKKGAAWVRTEKHNLENSSRQQGKLRFNDGINNFTLDIDDPLIQEKNLQRGVIFSDSGKLNVLNSIKTRDNSYITGKKWFNDGFRNYRLNEEDGVIKGLIKGKIRRTIK